MLAGGVAFLLVDLHQQVEGVGEHVAAAAGRVKQLDLLGGGDGEAALLR